MEPLPTCRNCGAALESKFCADCGQSATIAEPSFRGLVQEGFSAVLSYDSRLWRTVRVLVTQPGELTRAYLAGQRTKYLSPFQLFFWLETATFFVNRLTFDRDNLTSDTKSKDLFLVGVAVVFGLWLAHLPTNRKFIQSLVCGTHLWAFLMTILLVTYAVLPVFEIAINQVTPALHFRVGIAATLIAVVAMLLYAPKALIKVYGDKGWFAAALTLALLSTYYILEITFQRFLHPNVSV